MFETTKWRAFFQALGGYTPLNRHTLADIILTICYKKVKSDIQHVFNSSLYLSIIFDKLTNITRTRIKNIFVICKGTLYNQSNKSIKYKNASAKNAIESIKKAILEITNKDLNRLFALSIDTCLTIQAVQNQFAKILELAYIFGVKCDLYKNQLVIKDIIDPKVVNKVQIASKIYNFQL